jgi:protein ImuA
MNITMRHLSHLAGRPADAASSAFSSARDAVRIGSPSRVPALPAHLAALRDRLRPGRPIGGILPFGDPRMDGCLPGGGLPLGQLHEISTTGLDTETGALSAGFIAGLLGRIIPGKPVFWVAPCSDLHPPGLLPYGFDPNRLVMVRPDKDADTLAAMEVALREGVAAAVVGEVRQFDRTASRRLQLACLRHGTTGFALRRWPYGHKGADREATVAVTRWLIAPVPSVRDDKEPGLPRWHVALTHARGGRPGEWIMEASDDATHPLRVVAALADHATDPRRLQLTG